jgi:hypothetical protein
MKYFLSAVRLSLPSPLMTCLVATSPSPDSLGQADPRQASPMDGPAAGHCVMD